MFEREAKKIDETKGIWNILFLTKSTNYFEFSKWILKKITKDGVCIYLTINRPYLALKEFMEEEKIDEERVQFIDAITKTIGGDFTERPNCKFLESPTDLTSFGIGVTNAYNKLSGKKEKIYLIVDTISTLLVYNSPISVIKFIHYINNRMKIFGINGVLLAMKEDLSEQMIATLSQFCNFVTEVGEE